jgi:hypothetical protein
MRCALTKGVPMDGSRFDRLTKLLSAPGSRRRALAGLLAGTLGLAGWSVGEDAAAHNLKAKCKKKSGEAKKKCLKKAKKHAATHTTTQPPPLPPTCAENCAANCSMCFARPDNTVLCGDGWDITGCDPCSSDGDCVGVNGPYCITHVVTRATGAQSRFDDEPSPTGCPPYPVGICTKITFCS